MVKNYLPVAEKIKLVEYVVKCCVYLKDDMYMCNHILKDMFLGVAILENYSEYKFSVDENGDYTNLVDEYDEYASNGTISSVIDEIGKEYYVLLEYVDSAIEHKINVENSVSGAILRVLNKFIDEVKTITPDSLNEVISVIKSFDKDALKILGNIT